MTMVMVVTRTAAMALTVATPAQMPERTLEQMLELKQAEMRRRFAVSRLFLQYAKDRAALKASLAPVLQADFDRVVPGHGAILETGGKARLAAAFAERGLAP